MASALDALLSGKKTSAQPQTSSSALDRLLTQPKVQPTPQPKQLNQRQPIVAPPQQKVTAGAVAKEIPGAIREVGVGTFNAIIRPFQRAGLNIYKTSEGIATLGAYAALKKAGKVQEANKLLQDFNKKVNTGKIAALDPKTGKPTLEESKPVTGPVEAAGVGTDIGLTLAGPMVGKALGRVNVGRKGFTITKPVAKVLATERPEKAVDVLRSVESRMERSSPQGKKIVGLVKESDSRFLPNVGKRVMELQDAKLNKVKNPLDITDALEGRIKPESLKPDQKKIFDVVDQIRKSVAERSQKVGLEIRTSGGGKVPFKPRENYFPHTIPNESQLSKGVVRKEVIAGAVKRGDFKTVAEATDALDKYVQFTKSGGKDHLDFFAKRLIKQEGTKVKPLPKLQPAKGMEDVADSFQRQTKEGIYSELKKAADPVIGSGAGRTPAEALANTGKAPFVNGKIGPDYLPGRIGDMQNKLNAIQGGLGDKLKVTGDISQKELEDRGIALAKEFLEPKLSLAEARGRVLRYFKASRQQRYGNLERAREIDLPFYDPNPKRVLPKYLASTERRLADAEVLGPNLEKVDQLLGTIKNPDVQDLMRRMVKVIRPGANQGEQLAGKALDFTRGISTTRLSPLSGITNLGQSSNSYLASDAKSFLKGFTKAIFTKEGRRLPIESGNLAESVLRAIQQQAGGDSRLVGGYLKAIGFTQTEQLNRRIGSNVGAEYGKSLYKKLLKNPTNKLIRSELQDLELNPDDLLKTGFNKDSVLRAAKVFTDRTQFRSREIDLPSIATTTPIGKNLAQFKTFAFQQSRFISKQTIGQLKTNPRRALRNIAILATVYPLTGEAIADLRSIISGKERTNRGIERYVEDAAQVGAFGIIYDAIKSASFEGGVGKFLLGPTLSGILDNIDLTKKSLDKGFSDAEKRDYIRQIPGVGPVAAARLLPPEKKVENKNTGSGKEIVKDSGFGETTIPKPTFRVDGKNVGLKPAQAKEYQGEVVRAYTDSLAEASKQSGWNEKDNAGKKKEFDKIFNKKKTAIQQKWLDTGKLNPNTIAGENRLTEGPADPYRVVANYGKGFLTDPEQTLKALFTKERLRDVVGPIGKGVVRLERQKFLSLLDKGDKGKVIDHIIPLTLGGTNDPSNLRVIPEKQNQEKAKEEVRLLNLVKQGKMTRQQAQAEIRKFR